MDKKCLLYILPFLGTFWLSAGEDCTKSVCHLNDDSLRFFLIGDWGGLPVWPFFSSAQSIVAGAMGTLGRQFKTQFQIALGDNFYMVGVTDEYDKRFQATFENVYTQTVLRRTPWYVIAGNHDHHGNTTAQIAYSRRSWRWNFPDLHYVIRYQLNNNVTVDFIMIDTVILCGSSRDGKYDSIIGYLTASSSKPTGPTNKKKAEEHWRWIEDHLQNSKADYVFVSGHYPVYSIADHGPTQCLIDRLNPLLFKYNASVYFCGHDHNLQHLRVKRDNFGNHFDYIVSGGGAFTDSSSEHIKDVPVNSSLFIHPEPHWLNLLSNVGFSSGGFVYGDVNERDATFTYYTGDKKRLYEFKVKPRNF